ncbi:MAG: V-type ATPase subunit, partial [Planctomycetota bacterium]
MSDMENSVRHYDWCYVSGRVNVLEFNLLNATFYERLLSSDDLGNVVANLSNTPLKDYFTHVKHLYEYETLLDENYYSRLYEIRSLSPDSAICDFFLIRNDIFNLKKFVKSKACGTSVGKYFRGTIDKNKYDNAWNGKTTSLPELVNESISLFKRSMATVKKEELPFIIDLIIDGVYLKYIESICKRIEVEIVKRYMMAYQFFKGFEAIRRAVVLRFDMDILNKYYLERFDQKHVFRKLAKNTAWTSDKTFREIMAETHCDASLPDLVQMLLSDLSQNISFRYEVLTDDYLLDMIRPVKYTPFGPEKVFGYLCGLTTEVFNLKLVLGGKVHKIGNNLLKERLRKAYV